MADLAARWKDLGISLGIRLSELNATLSTHPYSPSDCLRETLVIWLKQNYDVRTILILPQYTKFTNRHKIEASKTWGCILHVSGYSLPFPLLSRWRGLGSQHGEDWWRVWRTMWEAATMLWPRK